MVRTQIQLTHEQARKLKALAASTDQSLAALIRRAVDQFLIAGPPDIDDRYRQARSVIGKHTADHGNVASDHDHYLHEAFGS